MRQDNRYDRVLVVLLCVLGVLLAADTGASAQASAPEPGDPPVAALISVSPADENGIVMISGGAGSVFPVAQVAIRNLYTEQTVYTNAGIQGTFSAQIFGPGNTPFHISPAPQIPNDLRDRPGSLPGGPGTIVYGTQPEARSEVTPVTAVLLDAALDDWAAYPGTALNDTVYALLNRDSLLLAVDDVLPDGALLAVQATFNGITYDIAFNPRLPQAAILREVAPVERDLGTLAVASAIREDGDVIEARIPVADLIPGELTEAVLNAVIVRDGEGAEIEAIALAQSLTQRDERDGIVYPGGASNGGAIRFSVAGPLAQGAAVWTAAGRINGVEFVPGDEVRVEMDITLDAPEFPASLVGLSLIGEVYLQPVAIDSDGDATAEQNIAARLANNGWSNLLTRSGLARDNVSGDLLLGRVMVPAGQVVRRDGRLLAGMRFDLTLPDDLPPGLYVPVFAGFGQVGDGEVFSWRENGVFGTGSGISANPFSRLPLVLNVGTIESARQPWALFMSHPSDGARGLLPDEDAGRIALSTRVKMPPPTYILPPGAYSLEPYIPGQLANSATTTVAPLVPTLFPGGRLNAVVNRPDGIVDELASVAIVQNVVGTAAIDEAERYGARNLLDFYRLATLNPAVDAYNFDAYGAYEIMLTGNVEDIRGNRYDGGGTYRLLVAELLDLLPGVLPGTPFEVGDALYAGVTLLPGVPAEVQVDVTVYPVGGGDPITWATAGTANRRGVFSPAESFAFSTAGEYVIDYEARYTDANGVLYAASLRSAGVIGTPDTSLIVHGQRGTGNYTDYRPAWFDAASYPPDALDADEPASFYFPYFAGDVVVIPDDGSSGLTPSLRVQDTGGAYADWLVGTIPDYVSDFGDDIERLRVEGSLPLLPVLGGPPTPFGAALVPDFISNEAYGYISAVRPGVSVRQFVTGGEDGGLDLGWNTADRYNDQIGAGDTGDRPGDVVFLFGGAVIRNAEAGVNDAAIYASLAAIGDEDVSGGVYPPYRGAAGGADGGPITTVGGESYAAIIHATGAKPGQTYDIGDALRLAGQVGPTVASEVQVTLTAPDGTRTHLVIPTNAIGYFFDPEAAVTLDQAGVWSVRMTATPTGATSVGLPEAPLPVATIPGTPDGVFDIYVLPRGSDPLTYNDVTGNVDAPVNPGVPFNFSETVPQGWTDAVAYRTVTIPGYVLETGAFPLTGRSAIYTYSPANLARDFPMLEFEGRGEGPSASDVVTLTFTITGLDENGQSVIQSRTFHILHDRLVSFVGD